MTSIMLHEATIDGQNEHITIESAKPITILAEVDSLVVVERSKCGLMTIERIQMARPTQMIHRTKDA